MSMLMTFGELMLRISPAGTTRLVTTTVADLAFGGAECNVAVCAAMMGSQSRYVTALPENVIADSAVMKVRSFGVDTAFMHRIPGRIGIYFVEPASGIQPASVIYDRTGSAVTCWHPSDNDIYQMLTDITHFHFTGITVALGGETTTTLDRILQACKSKGVHITMDVNYRMKLWDIPQATVGLSPFISYVDTLICNENHARMLFACNSDDDDTKAKTLHERFPNLTNVVISRRRANDSFHDSWGVTAVDKIGQMFRSEERVIPMVERVGGGDAFAGAFLSELMAVKPMQHCLDFGAAALALKHGIPGDFCTFTRTDVENVMVADSSMGVVR